MRNKHFPFYRRLLFKLLIPVLIIGFGASYMLVTYMSAPLESDITRKIDSDLQSTSIMGLMVCEDSFSYLLDLRLENDPEMIVAMQRELFDKLETISNMFPQVRLMVVQSGKLILTNASKDSTVPWNGPDLSGLDDTSITFNLSGENVKSHVQFFPFWDWHVVSYVFERDYRAPLRKTRAITFFSGAGVFLIVITILLIVFHFLINRPLNKLIAATNSVAEGHLSRITIDTSSEISQLMESFNSMIGSLKNEKSEVRSLIDRLQQSESMLRLILDTIPVRVFWKDRESRYLGGNKPFMEDAGLLSGEELCGKTDNDLAFTAQAGLYRRDDKAVMDSGQAKLFCEEPQDRPDGKTNWVLTSKVPMRDGQDQIIGLLGTYLDITERKNNERELRSLRNYLSNIINSMPSVIVGVTREGIVTQWNKEAERTTGIPSREAEGSPFIDFAPMLHVEIAQIDTAILSRQPQSDLKRSRKESGKTVYENITVYPLSVNGAEGAVIRIDDVTREQQLEEQLNHSMKLEAIGTLASGVAHDFNNMLGGILGAAELLAFYLTDDPKAKKFQQTIVEAATRASVLTSQLLTFSRLNPQASTLVDLHEIISEVKVLLNNTIDRRVALEFKLNSDNSAIIGDPSQLHNMFLNLGINAAHAMPDGGTISITTQNVEFDASYCRASTFDIEPGQYLEIEVRDTGCGIPSDHMNKIFDPFFTTKGPESGTGLGLAAVYGSVKQHKGAIHVYSEQGRGTAFHIFFPISEGEKNIEESATEVKTGSGKILVVDDELVMRVTAQAILEDLGYQVVLAEDGQQALTIFQEEEAAFDLVLLDMVMPVMNGRDCFSQLKQLSEDVRVILSSGFARQEDVQEMQLEGLKGMIKKPYSRSELSNMVFKALH